MAVAIGKVYRDGNNLMGRAILDGLTVSKFFPFRSGTSMMLRGKNSAGQVVYGFPFRSGNDVLFRTIAAGGVPGCSQACLITLPLTYQAVITATPAALYPPEVQGTHTFSRTFNTQSFWLKRFNTAFGIYGFAVQCNSAPLIDPYYSGTVDDPGLLQPAQSTERVVICDPVGTYHVTYTLGGIVRNVTIVMS